MIASHKGVLLHSTSVGEGVHLVWVGEHALGPGEDVTNGEENGLAAAPKNLAE